jgi:hypothetical protein
MARQARSIKAITWRRRIRRFDRSRLTVTRFCEEEGVSVASFYWWRKRLAGERLPSGKHAVPPAPSDGNERSAATQAIDSSPIFQTVRLVPTSPSMSIYLPGGSRVEVPAGNWDAVRDILVELTRPSTNSQ